MELQKLEIRYRNLISILRDERSPRTSLLYLNDFLGILLSLDDGLILESYFVEFVPEFIKLLKQFNLTGISPERLQSILSNAKRMLKIDCFDAYKYDLAEAINEFERKYLIMNRILDGEEDLYFTDGRTGISFPVIEKHPFNAEQFGTIEYVSVHIQKGNKLNSDNFLVIPSQEKLEKKIHSQILTSWKIAKEFCSKRIKKLAPFHEIIISFSEKYGNYVGESLGVALTLAFIQQLHNLYNLTITVSINNAVCFTGGLDEDGYVKPVSSKIAEQKVETVFYSCKTIFAIPKKDEITAREKLERLKKKHPRRKLKLVAIDDLDDILNRRNLINLDKQSLVKRSVKALQSRKITAILSLILLSIIFYNALRYFDNNPVMFNRNGNLLNVENKYGKVLFTKKLSFSTPSSHQNRKLFDINNDGINEVILCVEKLKETSEANKNGRIACFDNSGDLIWEYILTTKLSTQKENFPEQYVIRLILDIVKEDNLNVIYAAAQNIVYYPNIIFRLDARTGKRLPGTFLHSGSIERGIIGDFNKDGKKELVAAGINNGYERAIMFSINLEELKKESQGLSAPNYSFKNFNIASFNGYLLLPKTDYNKYQRLRFNNILYIALNPRDSNIYFSTIEGAYPTDSVGVSYSIDRSFTSPKVIIGDDFQVKRDSLVAQGNLNLPFTNTKEYEKILLNQFEKWEPAAKKFVKITGN